MNDTQANNNPVEAVEVDRLEMLAGLITVLATILTVFAAILMVGGLVWGIELIASSRGNRLSSDYNFIGVSLGIGFFLLMLAASAKAWAARAVES